MLSTNSDPSQVSERHARLFARWDAQGGKSVRGKILLRPFVAVPQILRGLRTSPLWYAIESELRGILPRIRLRLTREMFDRGCLGTPYQVDANGHLVPNMSTRGRIQGMQALASSHIWAAEVEHYFYLKGWEEGATWERYTMGIEHKESLPPS
jgi:hypothetical protein